MKKIGKQLKEQNIMKKTLYIAAAVIAVMFAASCQKDDVQAAKKGMTLSANVEETKATIERDATGEKVVWHFSWEIGDVVSVKSPLGKLYDFIYDGTSFKCETAEPEPGIWTAVYPASAQDGAFLINIQEKDNPKTQDGTLKSVMKNYLMDGASENYEEAETTISIKMTPKIAIVQITNNTDNAIMMNFTTNKGDTWNAATNVASIDASGKVKGTNTYSMGSYAGTISSGKTNYYIAPANQNIYVQTRNSDSGPKSYTGPKTLTAGTVYNVVF